MPEIPFDVHGTNAVDALRNKDYSLSITQRGLIAHELVTLRAVRDAAIVQLSAEARLRDAAEAERDRYKAVVERLPKTADGVPVVPGMYLWSTDRQEPSRVYGVGRMFSQVTHGGACENPRFQSVKTSECYSTREAAEQARRSFTNAESQGVQDG